MSDDIKAVYLLLSMHSTQICERVVSHPFKDHLLHRLTLSWVPTLPALCRSASQLDKPDVDLVSISKYSEWDECVSLIFQSSKIGLGYISASIWASVVHFYILRDLPHEAGTPMRQMDGSLCTPRTTTNKNILVSVLVLGIFKSFWQFPNFAFILLPITAKWVILLFDKRIPNPFSSLWL